MKGVADAAEEEELVDEEALVEAVFPILVAAIVLPSPAVEVDYMATNLDERIADSTAAY